MCEFYDVILMGCGGVVTPLLHLLPARGQSLSIMVAPFKQDGGARRDRDVLGDRDRQQSFDLPVAEERGSDFRCDFGQLHHRRQSPLADNGAKFRVVVSNSLGSATSNPATLTVSSTRPRPSVLTS